MSETKRRLVTYLAPIAAVLLAAPGGASAPSKNIELATILRPGRFQAQELQPWAPPRFVELGNRMKAAAEADPDWAREQALKSKPGQPLPYDSKMGVTEAEYGEFLKLQSTLVMKPVRTVTVVLEPVEGGWRFGKGTTAEGLVGITVDTLRNQVHTPQGDLQPGAPVVANKSQSATGQWAGPRWRGDFIDPSTQSGVILVFAAGKHMETGRPVIYLETRRLDQGHVLENKKSFFRYLPAKAGATKAVSKKKRTVKRATSSSGKAR